MVWRRRTSGQRSRKEAKGGFYLDLELIAVRPVYPPPVRAGGWRGLLDFSRRSAKDLSGPSSALDRFDPWVLSAIVLFVLASVALYLELFAIRLDVTGDCFPLGRFILFHFHCCSPLLGCGLAGTIRAPTRRFTTCNTRAKGPIKSSQSGKSIGNVDYRRTGTVQGCGAGRAPPNPSEQ